MNFKLWDGTLSPCEFVTAAYGVAEKWNRLSHDLPSWSWVPSKRSPLASSNQVEGYLSLEKHCVFSSNRATGESSCYPHGELKGISNLNGEPVGEVHYYDFHVVYSSSYRVPTMYFRGYHSDGQRLVLNEIEKDLPSSSGEMLAKSKWTFITEMEHPYLNRPWFMLHPCGSNELMKLLLAKDVSPSKDGDGDGDGVGVCAAEYLISWLSVVGQVVGLRVPLQMAPPS